MSRKGGSGIMGGGMFGNSMISNRRGPIRTKPGSSAAKKYVQKTPQNAAFGRSASAPGGAIGGVRPSSTGGFVRKPMDSSEGKPCGGIGKPGLPKVEEGDSSGKRFSARPLPKPPSYSAAPSRPPAAHKPAPKPQYTPKPPPTSATPPPKYSQQKPASKPRSSSCTPSPPPMKPKTKKSTPKKRTPSRSSSSSSSRSSSGSPIPSIPESTKPPSQKQPASSPPSSKRAYSAKPDIFRPIKSKPSAPPHHKHTQNAIQVEGWDPRVVARDLQKRAGKSDNSALRSCSYHVEQLVLAFS